MEQFRTARLIVRDWAETDAPAALGIYGRADQGADVPVLP